MKLDTYDWKLLRHLQDNGRMFMSQTAKKTELSKSQVRYRLKKLTEKQVIIKTFPLINLNKFNIVCHHLYFKLDVSQLNKNNIFIEKLKTEPGVIGFNISEGIFDIRCVVVSKSLRDFYLFYSKLFNEFSEVIVSEKIYLLTQINYHKYLSISQKSITLYDINNPENKEELSSNYSAILDILNKDSRTTAVEISKQTQMSLRSVLYSLKKIKSEKIILGHSILIDDKKTGYLNFVIDISIKKKSAFDEIIAFFHSKGILRYSYRHLGNYNLTLDIIAKDSESFQKILKEFKEIYTHNFFELNTSIVSYNYFTGWFPKNLEFLPSKQ